MPILKSPRFHKIILEESDVFGATAAAAISYIRYRLKGGVKIYHLEGKSWVMVPFKELAENMGVALITAKRTIDHLEKKNVLSRKRIKPPYGQFVNVYALDEDVLKKATGGNYTPLGGDQSEYQHESHSKSHDEYQSKYHSEYQNEYHDGYQNDTHSHYIYKKEREGETPSLSSSLSGNAHAFQPDDGVIRASLSDGRADASCQAEEVKIPDALDVRGVSAPLGDILSRWFEEVKTRDPEVQAARLAEYEASQPRNITHMPNTAPLRHPTQPNRKNDSSTSKTPKKAAQTPLTCEESLSPLIDVVANNIFTLTEEHYKKLSVGGTIKVPSIILIRKTIRRFYKNNPNLLMEKVVKELRDNPTTCLSRFFIQHDSNKVSKRQIKI